VQNYRMPAGVQNYASVILHTRHFVILQNGKFNDFVIYYVNSLYNY